MKARAHALPGIPSTTLKPFQIGEPAADFAIAGSFRGARRHARVGEATVSTPSQTVERRR